MPILSWDGLQKNATDDETIEEAIARLVAVHEADSTAHLGVGESLQSHKSEDIIDHPALSIVPDKISNAEKVFDFALGIYNASNIDNCLFLSDSFYTQIYQTSGYSDWGSYYILTILPYDYGYADGDVMIDFLYFNTNENYTWEHHLYFGFCRLEFKYLYMRIGYYTTSWQYTSWTSWTEQSFQHFRIHFDSVNGLLLVYFRDTNIFSQSFTMAMENDELSMQLWINRGNQSTNTLRMSNLKLYMSGL